MEAPEAQGDRDARGQEAHAVTLRPFGIEFKGRARLSLTDACALGSVLFAHRVVRIGESTKRVAAPGPH